NSPRPSSKTNCSPPPSTSAYPKRKPPPPSEAASTPDSENHAAAPALDQPTAVKEQEIMQPIRTVMLEAGRLTAALSMTWPTSSGQLNGTPTATARSTIRTR